MQVGVEDAPLVVEEHVLAQNFARAHHDRALDLAVEGDRVDHRARVVGVGESDDLDHAGFGVDLDLAHRGTEAEGRRGADRRALEVTPETRTAARSSRSRPAGRRPRNSAAPLRQSPCPTWGAASMKIGGPRETSASGSQPSSRAATRYSLELTSSAATLTALPRHQGDPARVGPEIDRSDRRIAFGHRHIAESRPRASVATCSRTVSEPCPISAAAIIRVAPSPSSRMRMIAFE